MSECCSLWSPSSSIYFCPSVARQSRCLRDAILEHVFVLRKLILHARGLTLYRLVSFHRFWSVTEFINAGWCGHKTKLLWEVLLHFPLTFQRVLVHARKWARRCIPFGIIWNWFMENSDIFSMCYWLVFTLWYRITIQTYVGIYIIMFDKIELSRISTSQLIP